MTYISAFITFFISLATMIIALRQYYISKQQKNIALYEHRYHKIYKLFFDTIDQQQNILIPLQQHDLNDLHKITDHFAEEMSFARFLISETDFSKIMDIYTEISHLLAQFFSDNMNTDPIEYSQRYKRLNQQLTTCKEKFCDVISPYLQIERDNFFSRILNKIRKKK